MENNSSVKADGYLWKGFRFVRLLLIIVAVSWLFKSYLFSVYYIPSGSMSPTLQPGDYVLVSKFPYNLRSPEYYPLSNIPFLSFSVDGMGEVRQVDIMVFDLPVFPTELHPTQKENYVKRNAGLPGDTILIRHDRYLLRKNYTSKRDTNVARRSQGSIAMMIPGKGTTIQLTDSTKSFWEPIIMRDGNSVTYHSSGHILVNGERKTRYQVQQKYYFVQGDNIRFSSDSRLGGRKLFNRSGRSCALAVAAEMVVTLVQDSSIDLSKNKFR